MGALRLKGGMAAGMGACSVVAGMNGALGKFPYMGSLTSHEFYEMGTNFQIYKV
jgi:hypothetical protein